MPASKGFRPSNGGFRKKTVPYIQESEELEEDYLNIQMLKGYLTESGQIVPRRVTDLTAEQQRKVTRAIKLARFLALLPYVG